METTKISLIGSKNNIFIKYPTSFWLMITVVILVISALFYVNNFSQSSRNKILQDTSANAEKLSGFFHEIETDSVNSIVPLLAEYKNDILYYDDINFFESTEKTINTLFSPLVENNDNIAAYFYILSSSITSPPIEKIYDKDSGDFKSFNLIDNSGKNIDKYLLDKAARYNKPFWEMCIFGTGRDVVSYIIPLGDGMGVAGIVFPIDKIFNYIDESGFSNDKFPLLLSAENRNIISNNSVSELLKERLFISPLSNSGVISFEDNNFTFFYSRLNSDLFYLEANSLIHTRFLSNVYIFCLSLISLFCVWIIQGDRFTGKNFFEFISQKITKQGMSAISVSSNTAIIALQISLGLALLFQFILSVFANDEPIVSMFYLVILLIGSIGFILYKRDNPDSLSTCLFVLFVSITPLIMHFVLGGYLPEREPYEVVWVACAVVIAALLLSRRFSRISFSLIVVMILISVVIELQYFNQVSSIEIIAYSLNIILVCLLIFSSVESYYNNTKKDFDVLRDETIQIKETQSAFVHKEKMVTLGQLIAGVAHEINTPIGAVKAAGETLEAMSNKMLTKLISETKDYSKEDLEAFIDLVNMCVASIKEMRSTMETRKAKAAIRDYFQSVGLDNYAELTNLVTKLEICDIEKIDDNLDLFFNPRITELLNMVSVVMPYLNGTQTVIFASNRVAKIVFALKAFAHTSSSSEFIWYDVAKNIENIIILYHNQIKAGIEVIQDYDDNIPDLFGNPDEIGQVWTNFVQNAIYAMSGVGTLKISIRNDNNNWVRISFTDSGTGIKEENLKHIFEAFYTTKPLGEGSGLGLDICNKIIQKHEGTIDVSSKYGSGTTFTVSFPIKDKE